MMDGAQSILNAIVQSRRLGSEQLWPYATYRRLAVVSGTRLCHSFDHDIPFATERAQITLCPTQHVGIRLPAQKAVSARASPKTP